MNLSLISKLKMKTIFIYRNRSLPSLDENIVLIFECSKVNGTRANEDPSTTTRP